MVLRLGLWVVGLRACGSWVYGFGVWVLGFLVLRLRAQVWHGMVWYRRGEESRAEQSGVEPYRQSSAV